MKSAFNQIIDSYLAAKDDAYEIVQDHVQKIELAMIERSAVSGERELIPLAKDAAMMCWKERGDPMTEKAVSSVWKKFARTRMNILDKIESPNERVMADVMTGKPVINFTCQMLRSSR